MQNDRNNATEDEKYEGYDDSEYHFSEEEVSYEVEQDTSKPAQEKPKRNPFKNLSSSRRMLLSAGVFIVLVLIVYKMVAPTSQNVSTDIAAAPMASRTTTTKTTTQVTRPKVAPANQIPTVVTNQPPPAPVMPNNVPTSMPQVGVMPSNNVAAGTQPVVVQSLQQTIPATQPTAQAGTPNVVAVQTQPVPNAYGNQPYVPPTPSAINANNDAQRLMSQIQADYNQKLNDYANRNKGLEDQVQTLSDKVNIMQTQLNQLIQALTKPTAQTETTAGNSAAQPLRRAIEASAAYNVQAIIPGRAWLRADNGETVTVAEGDVIRDLGRVTKIDPYEGVVEINTGNKVISLSYGG